MLVPVQNWLVARVELFDRVCRSNWSLVGNIVPPEIYPDCCRDWPLISFSNHVIILVGEFATLFTFIFFNNTFKVHFVYNTFYVLFVYNTYIYVPCVVTQLIHVQNKHINTRLISISIISFLHFCPCSSLDFICLS